MLGAGVSAPRGVPDWRQLTRALWETLAGQTRIQVGSRTGVRRSPASAIGSTRTKRPDWPIGSASTFPIRFADQMAIELLRQRSGDDPRFFTGADHRLLPRSKTLADGRDTLGVLARILIADQAADRRRVLRVITFNADDHLETEGNRGRNPRREPVLWPMAGAAATRGCHAARTASLPFPFYHVHGFLRATASCGPGATPLIRSYSATPSTGLPSRAP